MKIKSLFFVCLIATRSVAHLHAQDSLQKDREAISALRDEQSRAINAQDAGRLLAGVTDDVVYLAPDQREVVGKPALATLLSSTYTKVKTPGTRMVSSEVIVSGDFAYEWGHMEATNKAIRAVNGKYLHVYKRQSGNQWLVARMMFNADSVPPS